MSSRRDGQTGARPIKAIGQTRLTLTIYKLLRTKLANHEFALGERLQLGVLAGQLGVSRTPVREALNQLAAEGLIEIRPRRGTRDSSSTRVSGDVWVVLRVASAA